MQRRRALTDSPAVSGVFFVLFIAPSLTVLIFPLQRLCTSGSYPANTGQSPRCTVRALDDKAQAAAGENETPFEAQA
jgi:hypothetical protein